MEQVIEQLAGYGMPGLIVGMIVFFLRDDLRKILTGKGGINADLADAMKANTEAVANQHAQFEANNKLFQQTVQEITRVNEHLMDLKVEIIRLHGGQH